MSVRYESNNDGREKYSWGGPELIVSYPKEPLTLDELLDYVTGELNEGSCCDEVSQFIQSQAQEGAAEADVVERNKDGRLNLHIQDGVYAGEGNYRYNQVDLILDHFFSEEGIHLRIASAVPEEEW